MLVKNWMTKEVVTADAEMSIQDAAVIMKEHDAHILPIVEQGKLAGILTRGDLKRGMVSKGIPLEIHELLVLMAKRPIKDIMIPNPMAVAVDATVEEAADLLIEKAISAAPVVDHKRQVVGLITQKHMLRVLLFLTGVHRKGLQIGFQLENRPGSIKEVTDVMRRYGCRLISVLSTYDDKYGQRYVYIRAVHCDRRQMEEMKRKLRSTANMLYLVDFREEAKEYYQEDTGPGSELFIG
jgi:acetoin utilization protein AcuB